jgi:hypothetical protein
MARSEPAWIEQAAEMLAAGSTVTVVAKAVGVGREALSRRLNAPGSPLRAAVESKRAAVAVDTADKKATLLERAMAVFEQGLSSADERRAFDSAKILLAKLMPSQQTVRIEESPAATLATPEDLIRDLASALTEAALIIGQGGVSDEAIALLAEAAARLVAVLPRRAPQVQTNGAAPAVVGAGPHTLQ